MLSLLTGVILGVRNRIGAYRSLAICRPPHTLQGEQQASPGVWPPPPSCLFIGPVRPHMTLMDQQESHDDVWRGMGLDTRGSLYDKQRGLKAL